MLARYLRIGELIEVLAAIVVARALVLAGVHRGSRSFSRRLLPLAVQGVPLASSSSPAR